MDLHPNQYKCFYYYYYLFFHFLTIILQKKIVILERKGLCRKERIMFEKKKKEVTYSYYWQPSGREACSISGVPQCGDLWLKGILGNFLC